MKDMGIAIKIAVDKLREHPDNPRKEIRDIEEMVESVAKNGIMQNLTVIPLEALEKEPEEQCSANAAMLKEDFVVLIGHRRLAAAKAAGLHEVPCRIVSKISKKEQVAIMLEENMQRNDLTIWEQANGFQMMLDLGDTEEQIAEKTGFSRQTIKHRLNIAKLNQQELMKKEKDDNFQLTLKHLYALEKIKDVETRNRILKEANSANDMNWRINQEINRVRREKNFRELEETVKRMGIMKAPKAAENERWSGKWETVREISLDEELTKEIEIKLPKEDAKRPFYYFQYSTRFCIIRLAKGKKVEKLSREEQERKDRDRRKKQIKAMVKQLHERMKEMIMGIVEGKIEPAKEELRGQLWELLLYCGSYISCQSSVEFITGKHQYEVETAKREEIVKDFMGMEMTKQMLIVLWDELKSEYEIYDWKCIYKKEIADKWNRTADILGNYGFYLEEEEKELMEGVHELFTREKVDGKETT
ncbi:MAG: ParB/RepB/Spo0J family partition protein [Lachnospiraceae bacterium]|nr:ParB/RepB/Spo0J family partition protein [Lachnospiraceae bacterium]